MRTVTKDLGYSELGIVWATGRHAWCNQKQFTNNDCPKYDAVNIK